VLTLGINENRDPEQLDKFEYSVTTRKIEILNCVSEKFRDVTCATNYVVDWL